jgi:hypothetical protein
MDFPSFTRFSGRDFFNEQIARLMQSVEGNDGFGSDHLYPPHCSTSLLDPT